MQTALDVAQGINASGHLIHRMKVEHSLANTSGCGRLLKAVRGMRATAHSHGPQDAHLGILEPR